MNFFQERLRRLTISCSHLPVNQLATTFELRLKQTKKRNQFPVIHKRAVTRAPEPRRACTKLAHIIASARELAKTSNTTSDAPRKGADGPEQGNGHEFHTTESRTERSDRLTAASDNLIVFDPGFAGYALTSQLRTNARSSNRWSGHGRRKRIHSTTSARDNAHVICRQNAIT